MKESYARQEECSGHVADGRRGAAGGAYEILPCALLGSLERGTKFEIPANEKSGNLKLVGNVESWSVGRVR